MYGNHIRDSGAIKLAAALSSFSRFTALDFSRNDLTDICTKALAMHLAGHASILRRMSFAHNYSLGNGIGAVAALLMR